MGRGNIARFFPLFRSSDFYKKIGKKIGMKNRNIKNRIGMFGSSGKKGKE